MRIAGINPINSFSMYTTPAYTNAIQKLATMKRINTAADDAAGLAISQKLIGQYRGLDRVASNVREFRDLISTADGGMDSITDNLQRMRELTIQASNTIYTKEDKAAIQQEIDQLKGAINDTVNTVRFNDMNLLDGTFKNKFVTVNANGAGTRVSIDNMSAIGLSVQNLSVMGDNPSKMLGTIDSAMQTVNSERAELGAQVNRFDHTFNNVNNASENMKASDSRIAGLDWAGVSNSINRVNLDYILNSYRYFMLGQQNQMGLNSISYLL